jgi:hypothetical protein
MASPASIGRSSTGTIWTTGNSADYLMSQGVQLGFGSIVPSDGCAVVWWRYETDYEY